ncbi:hypothetical protein EJB05_43800, partial [Eragrostis curvula]
MMRPRSAAAAPYNSTAGNSNDVRDEEGIPDLEDEDMRGTLGHGKAAKEEGRSSTGDELPRESKSSEASSSGGSLEHDVHVVEKSVVGEQVQRSEPHQHVAGLPPAGSEKLYSDDTEVVREIKTQFERASESAASLRDDGMRDTNQWRRNFCGSKRIRQWDLAIFPRLYRNVHVEKKLLEEVKTEEKMRVLYDRKREELKMLGEKGAEPDKLEATEIYIRKFINKNKHSYSDKISKLRDEELWPQTCELIQGLMRMWSVMLECHQIQLHAISQAKNIDSMINAAKFGDDHMDLIKRLELQLLEWIACFAAWVNAQKSYVRTLNQWLLNGVEYVPEDIREGSCRGNASLCVQCSKTLGEAQVRAKAGYDGQQKLDMDLRLMERDEQSMRKALEAQNKKLVLISNQSGGVSLSAQVYMRVALVLKMVSLQTSLKNIFEAMENFTAASANTYRDLHLRAEEEKVRVAQENDRVP